MHLRHHDFTNPAIDQRTDGRPRADYLDGRITIAEYLDRKFGTDFAQPTSCTPPEVISNGRRAARGTAGPRRMWTWR